MLDTMGLPSPALNPRIAGVTAPPIPAAHAWAARYDGSCGPMLDLCQAVPGYPPHPQILEHLAVAAGDPASAKYGLINGDVALREAYAAQVSGLYGGMVTPDQVAITAGCNQAFFLAMMAIAHAGDTVLLPTPWFWNHQQTCAMLGIAARSLPCPAEAGFVPDVEQAEALLDASVRAIVLITPNNPTGAVYPPDVIAGFAALCRRRGIWLVLDETYRDFLPDGQDRAHGMFADPDWASGVIQLYSFSKAYCVPGHRLGAVVAGAELVRQFMKVLDCMHICPQRAGQTALRWAIDALPDWRDANRRTINARAAAMRQAFERLPDWRLESLGAYFAYVRHPFPDAPAAQVAEALAVERGALCLPGSAFGPGQERHIRIAFANTDTDAIPQVADRLAGLCRVAQP
jgi:aspartate/methionine/tyrosine aminotransferase